MKKASALGIVPVLLFGIMGWQCLFLVAIRVHEELEWKSGSPENQLEKISFHKGDPGAVYFINDHELVYQGKLFDVKQREEHGDTVILYGKHDCVEEELLCAFLKKTDGQTGNALSSTSRTLQLAKLSTYLMPGPESKYPAVDFPVRDYAISKIEALRPGIRISFFVPPENCMN